jgi:diguanylate cyclase
VITRAQLTWRRLVTGSILVGLGIAGMHYTGDAAMRMRPGIVDDPALSVASIAIAIVASGAALWIARTLSDARQRYLNFKHLGAAVVMGLTITGMHYTANAAAMFLPGSVCGSASGIDMPWLATKVTLTFAILIVTLILSRFDARTTFLVHSVSQLNGQIVRMATFDTLTDLPNRHTLTERIEHAILPAGQHDKRFAVLFMDLDGFKTINDSLGHSMGDEVLKAFARRLQQCVRGTDTVARLGGDEFVVLLEDISSANDAGRMAESVLERMRKGVWDDGQPLQVTPSIGIAVYPQDGKTAEVLLKQADAAMYEAKREGRSTSSQSSAATVVSWWARRRCCVCHIRCSAPSRRRSSSRSPNARGRSYRSATGWCARPAGRSGAGSQRGCLRFASRSTCHHASWCNRISLPRSLTSRAASRSRPRSAITLFALSLTIRPEADSDLWGRFPVRPRSPSA